MSSPLFDRTLTESERALLLRSQAFLSAVLEKSAPREKLERESDAIMAEARALRESRDAVVEPGVMGVALVDALLRAQAYEATVRPMRVDPTRSPTLAAFVADARPDGAEGLMSRLRETLAGPPWNVDLEDAVARAKREQSELEEKVALTSVLEEATSLEPMKTFSLLFPGHPLLPGEVELIASRASLFFVVSLTHGQLPVRPGSDVASAYLNRVMALEQGQFANFPMFSGFRSKDADPGLLQALSSRTGLSLDQVTRRLDTMVTILQKSEVEKYIVHDTFGHQWQSLLFRYEEAFREVGALGSAPTPSTRHGGVSWAEAAHDQEKALAWVDSAFTDRVLVAMAGLVAEVLADVVEYKLIYTRPETRAVLLSSSVTPNASTKLDLTLRDLDRFLEMGIAGLRAFLETQSGDTGERARARLKELSTDAYVTSEGVTPRGRLALAFLRQLTWLDHVFHATKGVIPGFTGHFDVLVFYAAAYLERSWTERFWSLDEAIAEFPELWARLR